MMISKVNNSAVASAYMNNASKNKASGNVGTENAKELSKAEKIKEALNAGEYKVDIAATAQKMADELLQ